ncbi:MAG: ABC transporter substrate-binding protein, partial [Dehalococcoidia bacterium]|nr:ABC transporter substrate-binding protein [Dehalococcoidia bacterium]
DVLEMMFVAAIEKGYYKEEGLEVTLEVAPPQVGSKALMAGEFQFSGAGASNVVAALQGAPVKLVMNTAKGLLFWLYAAPGTSFTGLKGKPIGISGLGSIIHVQAKALLAKHGLDPDKDVAFVSAGSASQAMAMLKGGSVAAAVVGIPAVFEAEKAGLRSMAFIGDEIPTSTVGVATTDKLIQEKPELVRRFIRATLKGIRFIMARRGEALPMMQKFMELDQETVEKAYDVPRWRESGIAEASLLAADIEEQRKILNIAEPVPVEMVFNLSFVQAAYQDLQAANWKP